MRCQTSQLRLVAALPPSPQTGQHLFLLKLTNEDSVACYLFGYPGVTLYDENGKLLPFTYRWAGDQEVTSAPPLRVGLSPGGTAYVLINKYRCDFGTVDTAATLQLIPPDDSTALSLNIQDQMSENFCVPGGGGFSLAISPVEPSVQATLSG